MGSLTKKIRPPEGAEKDPQSAGSVPPPLLGYASRTRTPCGELRPPPLRGAPSARFGMKGAGLRC